MSDHNYQRSLNFKVYSFGCQMLILHRLNLVKSENTTTFDASQYGQQ